MNHFPISILDSSELYTGATRISAILSSTLPDDKYVTSSLVLFNKGTTDMQKALGKVLKSDYTTALSDKNKLREDAFLGLRDYTSAYTHSSNPSKKLAAIKLQAIIHTTGNTVYQLGYTDETTQMNSLIAALKEPEPTQWLQTIGATEWFTEVQATELGFENENTTKTTVESSINHPLLLAAKSRVIKSLVPLLSYIESNAEQHPDTFASVEKKIDAIITDIVTIARARITREENEKKKEEEKEKK